MTRIEKRESKELFSMAQFEEALENLKDAFRRATDTISQLVELREPFVEIEEENYTIRFPAWMFPTRITYLDFRWAFWWAFKNFNPPKRWKQWQDKRKNTVPLGTDTYIHKARKMRNLARGTKPNKSDSTKGKSQCKHTFRITVAKCAPCDGYNLNCEHYEKAKEDAADTKHLLR